MSDFGLKMGEFGLKKLVNSAYIQMKEVSDNICFQNTFQKTFCRVM